MAPTAWQHNIVLGKREPGDRHLDRKIVKAKGFPTQTQTATETYFGTETITLIHVKDLWNDGTGGYARLNEGGVGESKVIIDFKSQLHRGYEFELEIFGK